MEEKKKESFAYVFPLPAFLLPSCRPELTGADVPRPFQQMPVRSGQLLPVASDQAVGFVSLPATAFSVRAGLRAFLSSLVPRLQLMRRCPVEQSTLLFLPFL